MMISDTDKNNQSLSVAITSTFSQRTLTGTIPVALRCMWPVEVLHNIGPIPIILVPINYFEHYLWEKRLKSDEMIL